MQLQLHHQYHTTKAGTSIRHLLALVDEVVFLSCLQLTHSHVHIANACINKVHTLCYTNKLHTLCKCMHQQTTTLC